MTDTDDAVAEIEAGRPVKMLFTEGDTLFIPNTVAMIKECPNPEGAKKLIDYLLSPDVEMKLAQSDSRQIPLNPRVKLDAIKHLEAVRSVKALTVDFEKAVDGWQESQDFLVKEFALR
jgi:iron(III) transport system substrate-binding protein